MAIGELERRVGPLTSVQLLVLGPDNTALSLPKQDILTMLGVRDVVRVPEKEYPINGRPEDVVTHFNLRYKGSVPWEYDVMPRIVKEGSVIDNVETPPLLSFHDAWIVQLINLKDNIAPDDIPPEYFINTIGNIRNSQQMRERLEERYKKSHPNVSIADMRKYIDGGVTTRRFRLIDKVTFMGDI